MPATATYSVLIECPEGLLFPALAHEKLHLTGAELEGL